MKPWAKRSGFTIVELLIVVVVIAILAAITIIAYNGIQQRAKTSAVQTSLAQAARKIELYKIDNNSYPVDINSAGVNSGEYGNAYQRGLNGDTYCLSFIQGAVSYFVNETDASPRTGGCASSNGLVAEWLFNGNANDTSGSGMNGTVNGATLTTGRSGQANTAYSFNGSNNYIALSSSTPLSFTGGQFTVSTWVKVGTLPSVSAWYDILSSTGGGDWSVGINAASNGSGLLRMTKISQIDSPIGPVIPQNTWKLLTVVFNGPSPATVSYYVDGTLVSTVTWTYGGQGNFAPATKRIGSRASSGYFNGVIDDIRVYNRALSPDEITSLFASAS